MHTDLVNEEEHTESEATSAPVKERSNHLAAWSPQATNSVNLHFLKYTTPQHYSLQEPDRVCQHVTPTDLPVIFHQSWPPRHRVALQIIIFALFPHRAFSCR